MEKRWDRRKLKSLMYYGFIGTIADNIIEIGWILCFSLLANKAMVEQITTLFGLNDLFWVVLSATYYSTKTAITAILPKLMVKEGEEINSKVFKNNVYLFYIMLLPVGILLYIFIEPFLRLLAVSPDEMWLYVPYFKLSIISILFAAPWAAMIPSYLRTVGREKEASMLDHSIAWSMIIGIFISTHIFNMGVLTAMVINIITNCIPLVWFIINKPMKNFWKKGLEFDKKIIKESWNISKWELFRRLSSRVTGLISAPMIMITNPIFLGIKYWVSNLAIFSEGWVSVLSSTLLSHSSKNIGLKEKRPYSDHKYLFYKSVIGVIITIVIMYVVVLAFGIFLPESVYIGLINPIIYILMFIEVIFKLRYYMWISISRTGRLELNRMSQILYIIPTIILTPTLIYLFLIIFKLELIGIFLVSAIVQVVQTLGTEIYYRRKVKEL